MTETELARRGRQGTLSTSQEEVLETLMSHPFANLETYKYFNQRGELATQAKAAFIEAALSGGTPASPGFTYPAIDVDRVAALRDELTDVLRAALRLDMSDESNRLVREKVTERLHEAGIMLLTKLQSDLGPDHPLYTVVSFQLGANLRQVYGTPEPTHWLGILGYRLRQLGAVEERTNVPNGVRDAWHFVRNHLPSNLPIVKPYTPRPETMAWYAEQLNQRMAPGKDAVESALRSGKLKLNADNELDSDNIILATKLVLAARGISGWGVEPTDETNIDTSQERKAIYIPRTRLMTIKQFYGVIGSHEIDEHVARRENGDRMGIPILGGTGCSGYLGWEEGNGKANEALLKGAVNNEESAFNYYLSGGLALGLDDPRRGGRNYGQTFDLVWRMREVAAFLSGSLPDDSEDTRRATMDKAVDSLGRIFRGTDGITLGVVFTKDVMTYYLGQTEVWRKWDRDMELSEDDRKLEHSLERSAKIDPLRGEHRRVVIQAKAKAEAKAKTKVV